jgi:Glycosyltransferases involved in cell wall biogenesis
MKKEISIMTSPLVSIIIPAYNAEQWIEEAVNSCLNQSYKNIEVIVVNDGSTDGTLSVVQQISDSRLKVFSQMNMGACVARNRGFDESQGEYVNFFDADDTMYPDAIEKQIKHILGLPKGWISIGRFSFTAEI